MALRNATIFRWSPLGVSDTRESLSNRGNCRSVVNLIHDPTSEGVLACRPAVVTLTTFPGFISPGVVSLTYTVGTRIYGMVASGLTLGADQPFCYDTASSSFITITGVTSSNVPVTPSTVSDWSPPMAALVGTKLIVSHPGFAGSANRIGWFDLTNINSPVWNAGNITGLTPLASAPQAVGTFFNRAWYAVGNYVVFSDILNALNTTNANQALTIGNTSNVLALQPMPLSTGTQGILGSLMAFKATSIWQITGDASTTPSSLALNELTDSVGCLAPRTITPTPSGMLFMAIDGIRTVNQAGMVSEPNSDVVYPFYNITTPSRACAAYSSDTYRIALDSVTNTNASGRLDFWFSFKFQRWTGPHTYAYHTVSPLGNSFVLASNSVPGVLSQSNPYASLSDSYIELGTALSVAFTSSLINPQPAMSQKGAIEFETAIVPSASPYNVRLLSSQNSTIGTATLLAALAPITWGGGSLWGGGMLWSNAPYNLAISALDFPIPISMKTFVINFTGPSAVYFRVGHFSMRYEPLGYTGVDS